MQRLMKVSEKGETLQRQAAANGKIPLPVTYRCRWHLAASELVLVLEGGCPAGGGQDGKLHSSILGTLSVSGQV